MAEKRTSPVALVELGHSSARVGDGTFRDEEVGEQAGRAWNGRSNMGAMMAQSHGLHMSPEHSFQFYKRIA